jgi:Zn-dependent alcohol dehydrogenase
MKAAVCYEFNQPLRVEDVELDPPRSGEVKVRLAATALCHSDVHLMSGDWAARCRSSRGTKRPASSRSSAST